jgi:hypothetical protein
LGCWLAADFEADVADGLLVGELTFFRAATGFLKKLIFRFFNLLKQTVKPVVGVKHSDRKINVF